MSYTEFFVTKGASASNVNGGGPNLGTDDGPVDTSGNCSSDGGGTTITDDDAGGWPNASVGDWLCFDAAGSKDYARITNISGDDLTVTPAVTGSASGKTVNVGGAWATVDHAADTVTTSFVNAAGDPPRVNIESGTYAETVTCNRVATIAVPITYEGYATTPGDLGTRPLITGSADDAWRHTGNFCVVRNLRCETSTANKHGIDLEYGAGTHRQNTFVDLTVKGGSGTGCGMYWGSYGIDERVVRVYAKASGAHGFYINLSKYVHFEDCTSEDAGGDGFRVGNAWSEGITFVRCLADNPTDDGFYFTDVDQLRSMSGCIVYSPGSDAVEIAGSGSGTFFGRIEFCIFEGWTGYALNFASGCNVFEDHNQFYGSGTGTRNNVDLVGYHDSDQGGGTALTGSPFVDAAASDFNLNDTAGAGAVLRALTYSLG